MPSTTFDATYWRALRAKWQALSLAQRRRYLETLSDAELAAINWWYVAQARENQLPPPGDWTFWLASAGRGYGKTRMIAEFAHWKAESLPGSRGIILAATAADARDVLIEGISGIAHTGCLALRPTYNSSKRLVKWPNGSEAYVRSADSPDRLRGPQCHWFVADELASWRYGRTAWDMLLFGFRLGEHPQGAIATTPKNTEVYKHVLTLPGVRVVRGSSYENRDNLSPIFFEQIVANYEGTRLGRQELHAELLDDNEHALWRRAWLEAGRVVAAPQLTRLVVGVDPSGSRQGDAQGIIAAGVARVGGKPHLYVLEDATLHGTPDEWGRAALTLYYKLKANAIVVERNYGGDMVKHVLATIDPRVPVVEVDAARGKAVRAEPVAALYEQGRAHHVGVFAALEDELCQWEPASDFSPNRLDALVWAATDLGLGVSAPAISRQTRLAKEDAGWQ